MVDQSVVAGNFSFKFRDDGSARGDCHRLNPLQGGAPESSQHIHAVENLADHVERRSKVRTADAEKYSDRLTDFRLERMKLSERTDRSVENEILRMLGEQFFDAELLTAVLAERLVRVDFALHDIEFVVDLR